MASYTFYVLGSDCYLVAGTSVSCQDDREALTRAGDLLGIFNAEIEVWDAERKVGYVGANDLRTLVSAPNSN